MDHKYKLNKFANKKLDLCDHNLKINKHKIINKIPMFQCKNSLRINFNIHFAKKAFF